MFKSILLIPFLLIVNVTGRQSGDTPDAGPRLTTTAKSHYIKPKGADSLISLAEAYIKNGKIDLAEHELLAVLNRYTAIGFKNVNDIYDRLAEISKQKIDLHQELFYRLAIIKNMEASGDTSKADYYYAKLALVYSDLGMYRQSAEEIGKAIQIIKTKSRHGDLYGDLSLLVYDLIASHKPQKAIEILKQTIDGFPPENLAQRVDVNEEFAHCYTSLGEYNTAEKYYLEMMRLFKITSFNKAFYSKNEQMVTDFIYYNQTLADFYIKTKQYKKADKYLTHILQLPKGSVRPISLNKCYMMKFKTDSALGNYVAAIQQFELHKKLNDSLFNLSKSRQIEDLEIKYETTKKEDFIKVLQSRAGEQKIALQKATLEKNLTLIGVFMLLIIAGLTYNGYRSKNISNILLQRKEIKINEQNRSLELLLVEKDKLLEDKEVLVKEIHHRVKNNLHMISGLLESQSAYLKNDALAAVQNSQHRIQAISLIHQKLYLNDNVTDVLMSVYIREIVRYLQDSIIAEQRIVFKLDLDPIKLNVNQAVPIGLIINEAITNSIKHAFKKGELGFIEITMKQHECNKISLAIIDNGIGLSGNLRAGPGFNNSLGMNLIKGLGKSIKGKITINSNAGTFIKLVFLDDKFNDGLSGVLPLIQQNKLT